MTAPCGKMSCDPCGFSPCELVINGELENHNGFIRPAEAKSCQMERLEGVPSEETQWPCDVIDCQEDCRYWQTDSFAPRKGA